MGKDLLLFIYIDKELQYQQYCGHVARNHSRRTRGQFKYRELKTFGEFLVGGAQIPRTFKTVDNRGVIPTTERISNICKVRIQQFT
jgi:hypothetical protein